MAIILIFSAGTSPVLSTDSYLHSTKTERCENNENKQIVSESTTMGVSGCGLVCGTCGNSLPPCCLRKQPLVVGFLVAPWKPVVDVQVLEHDLLV